MKCQLKKTLELILDANVEKMSQGLIGVYLAFKSHFHTWMITTNSIICEHRGILELNVIVSLKLTRTIIYSTEQGLSLCRLKDSSSRDTGKILFMNM